MAAITDFITESLIQLTRSNGWFIQKQSRSLRPNVHTIHPICSKWYWKWLTSHLGGIVCTLELRQWLSLWMSHCIYSPDSFKRRFIHKQNNAVFEWRCAAAQLWVYLNYFSWWNRAKSCNTVIVRKCISLNINFLFIEITHCSYMPLS